MKLARDVFHDHGLRCTRQREAIYDALRATTSHPTAEELHGLVGHADEALSLATVYNALDAFVRCGLIRATRCGNGPCRYDADVCEHIHLLHPDGRVTDLSSDLSRELLDHLPEALLEKVASEAGVPRNELRVILEQAHVSKSHAQD